MNTIGIALAGYLAFGQPTGDYYEAITKHAGLQVIHANGAVTLRLRETGREETRDGAANTVAIRFKDETHPFEAVRHVRSWDDCDAVETWVEIRHSEPAPVKLLRADSFAAPLPDKLHGKGADDVRVMSLAGVGNNEANIRETTLAKGQWLELVSTAGTRDAWESNPAMMVSIGDGVGEESGKVLGVALEWSGTNRLRVRRNWNGRVLEVFAGVDMTTGPYTLDPGVPFATPHAILVWSEKGRGEVSRQFHRWAQLHLMPHGGTLHPVLLNSWEGSYFSFTEKTLVDMMDGVREMGGEMFVLDDGWFGHGKYARDEKNQARCGLGDWTVNPAKLPNGLAHLSEEAEKRGLKFGLWVEPEMVNTKSFMAEEHPDWLLREEGRSIVAGRGKTQTVLDFTNPEVRDNLFRQLDAVYSSVPKLAYVKWDCNANIWNPGSTHLPADRQPNLWYDYTMGYNELMARFRAKRPGVMVQACASGGGRMDFGSLRNADEFWASDRTDPYSRIFIQWGASQFYPASAMACHVTASPNHQTKRVTPLKYRFDVAMTGRLGFELHPKDLTPEETAFSKAAVADYKRIRPVVQLGDLYRLVSPYENPLSALMFAKGKGGGGCDAVVFALGLKIEGERIELLKLRGLDPDARYAVREINRGPRLHVAKSGGALCGDIEASGRELMENGLPVRLAGDYDSAVFEVSAKAPLPPRPSLKAEKIAATLADPLAWVYGDTTVASAEKIERFDAPQNGVVDVNILVEGAEPGERLAFAAESSLRGDDFAKAQWFRLGGVPVPRNTGLRGFLEPKPGQNPHVAKRAPFVAFDVLEPVGAGAVCSVSPDAAGRAAMRFRIDCGEAGWSKGGRSLSFAVSRGTQAPASRMSMHVEVHPAALPPVGKDSFKYTNWFNFQTMAQTHGLEPWSDAHWAMIEKYVRLAVSGRQNTAPLGLFDTIRPMKGCVLSLERTERLYEIYRRCGIWYFEGPQPAGFSAGWGSPTFNAAGTTNRSTSVEGALAISRLVGQMNDFAVSHGLKDRWYQHVADEPGGSNVSEYRITAGIVRRYMPGVKLAEAVEEPSFTGALDVWVPKVNAFDGNRAAYDRFMADFGDRVWCYTCCVPGGKWMNRTLDMELLRPALIPWVSTMCGVEGFLHWGFNCWSLSQKQDPFKEPYPKKWGGSNNGNSLPPGDTHIVYPGKDGPWPSARLEATRAGMEDADLLLAIGRSSKNTADGLVRRMARSFSDYSTSVREYRRTRRAILDSADGLERK